MALIVVFAVGCKDGDEPKTLHIYAASSLAEAFRELSHGFIEKHPESNVSITFAGSQVLRLQIEHGADADVVATANPAHMTALAEGGHVGQSRVFAHNTLAVVVPSDNPAGIQSFRDLPQAKRLVVGTDAVPVGRYTQQVVARAGQEYGAQFVQAVQDAVVSQENNVRLVRAKVALGEADAAIVYRTDAVASERVTLVPIPDELNVRAEYRIASISTSANAAWASAWMDYVASPAGRAILARHGFEVDG